MDKTVGCLSFFTPNHSQHSDQWLQKGNQMALVCFACFVELIENKDEPSIRKTRALQELLTMLAKGDILKILAVNESILSHLVNCLWQLIDDDPETTQSVTAIELMYQLCCSVKSDNLLDRVVEHASQKLVTTENIKKVFPHLNLVGKLLQKIPGLPERFIHRVNIVGYIAKSTAFPDEDVRSALFFILAVLYRDCYSEMSADITSVVLRECCEVLTSATSKELQINSVALLRSITTPQHFSTCSTVVTANMERLVTSLKKAFLARNDLVQTLAIGCLNNLLVYDERVISSDLIGFLFEVFKTKNESVLAQGFVCVSQLVENPELYTKGHALYGFETIVSALATPVENRNTKLVKQGFSVLMKILGNCPGELSLISGPSVLAKCLDILTSGLSSLDDGITLQACRCFSVFLEARHFACDMPYERLMMMVESLMERLGKICHGTGHWRRVDNKALKSSLLSAILEVMKRSLDLAASGIDELPTMESLLVAQENPTREALELFTNKLLQLCDQACIPNVIGNIRRFYDSTVPEQFYEILNKLLRMCPEDAAEMSRKFASSSFIRISLDTKAEYVGNANSTSLQSAVNGFLECICRQLLPRDFEQDVEVLVPSLQKVNGRAQELLQVLKQNHNGDENLKSIQECILVLFYTAYQHGDRLVPSIQLMHALSTFLVLNPSCYQHSSMVIPRCLTYLFITEGRRVADRIENTVALHSDAERILADGISQCNKVNMVYFHDFALVEWVVNMKELNPAIRKEIIELWFNHAAENDSATNDLELWRSLAKRSPDILLTFATILTSREHNIQSAVLAVLQSVFTSIDPECLAIKATVKNLKISLHELFLGQAVEPLADDNLAGVLKLLCLLVTSSPHTSLDDDVMKLVYHAVNLVVRSRDSCNLVTQCLNFLNVCLIQDSKIGSDKVGMFLTRHHDYNKFLEQIIVSFQESTPFKSSPKLSTVLSAVLASVACLVNFQKIFSVHSVNSIEIKVELALSLLCHPNPVLQLAATCFWTSAIECDKCSTNVVLKTRGEASCLSKSHRRIILVRLQNSLLQGNPLVQLSSLRCLKTLLCYEKDPKYLLQTPWNKAMLREIFDGCSPENLAFCLRVYSLFLHHKRKNGLPLDFPVRELLQVALKSFADYESDTNQVSTYAEFFSEVIQSSPDSLSSPDLSNLRTHVEHIQESLRETHGSTNSPPFIRVQEILVHEELIRVKRKDSMESLNKFLDVLR